MAMIDSRIERAGGQPVRVSWRVRETDGTFKILDIVAEGVSMAIALRSEYGTVLKNNGGQLPPLTEALREKVARSEEHTSELQSLMRISYAVFCLKKKKKNSEQLDDHTQIHSSINIDAPQSN